MKSKDNRTLFGLATAGGAQMKDEYILSYIDSLEEDDSLVVPVTIKNNTFLENAIPFVESFATTMGVEEELANILETNTMKVSKILAKVIIRNEVSRDGTFILSVLDEDIENKIAQKITDGLIVPELESLVKHKKQLFKNSIDSMMRIEAGNVNEELERMLNINSVSNALKSGSHSSHCVSNYVFNISASVTALTQMPKTILLNQLNELHRRGIGLRPSMIPFEVKGTFYQVSVDFASIINKISRALQIINT